MNVHRAAVARILPAPDILQDALAREKTARVFGKIQE
jgi:hypothetical protein